MAGDVLGIAASGLLAFQRALATTSHNISNVNTPGYSRQRIDFSTQTPQTTGAGFVGNGVITDTIRRNYDEFLTENVRSATSSTIDLKTFYEESARIADLLGDGQVGLSAGLDNFFGAVQDLSNDPGSGPARQVLLSEAASLVDRFQYLDQQLTDTRANVTNQLEGVISDINTLSTSISDMNNAISLARGQGGGSPPNDLLDQRDALIKKISEYVAVSTSEQDDGSVNVFIGNGQSLVTGTDVSELAVGYGTHDTFDSQIMFTSQSGTSVNITQNIVGGQLGGLLNFRDQVLDPAQSALGRIAIGLSDGINAQHALGVDLDGDLGGQFFGDVTSSQAAAGSSNTGDYQLTADVTDYTKLSTSDYMLSYDGAAYNLTRLSDSTSFGPFAGLPVDVTAQEGFTINLSTGTTINAGDSFLIRPARSGAGNLSMAISSTNDIAAASPVVINEATDATGTPSNGGNGTFGNVTVDNATGLPLTGITFTYDDTLKQFAYAGDVAGTIAYDSATDSGNSFSVNGVTFTVNGAPANGDVFVMSPNTNGSGDNRNMLALSDLQTSPTLDDANVSYQDAYAQLIGDIGTRTRQAELSAGAQEGMLRVAEQQRDSVSGVNLEEEAADLIRFQHAYEAMAQVISVAESVFQILIGAVRR